MSETESIKVFFIAAFFIVLLLLILIFSFVFLFRRRQNELLLKNQLEAEQHRNDILQKELDAKIRLEKERERISQDLHDDLGADLSAISLKADYLKSQSDNNQISEGLNEIVLSTREISLSMREMMWSLKSENDTLDSFVIYTQNFLKTFFEKSTISLQLHIPTILDDITMNSYVRRNLFLCIKEICHNILKHSKANLVSCTISIEQKMLLIVIQENGIGIPEDVKKGNGLIHLENRVKSIQGKLSIYSIPSHTQIKISLLLS